MSYMARTAIFLKCVIAVQEYRQDSVQK